MTPLRYPANENRLGHSTNAINLDREATIVVVACLDTLQ